MLAPPPDPIPILMLGDGGENSTVTTSIGIGDIAGYEGENVGPN